MANFTAYEDFNSYGTAFGEEAIDFTSFIDSTQTQDPFFDDHLTLSPSDYMNVQQQQNFLSSIPTTNVSNINYGQFDHQYPSTSTSTNTGSFPFPSQSSTFDQTASPVSESTPPTKTRTARRNAKVKAEPQPKPEPKKRGRKRKVHSSKIEADESRQRFLERNRIAASKCREKKKAWMDRLENMRFDLEAEKLQNLQTVLLLRQELRGLVDAAREHVEAGCAMHGLKNCVETGEARLVGVDEVLESQVKRAEKKMMGAGTPESDRDSAIELLSPAMGMDASKC